MVQVTERDRIAASLACGVKVDGPNVPEAHRKWLRTGQGGGDNSVRLNKVALAVATGRAEGVQTAMGAAMRSQPRLEAEPAVASLERAATMVTERLGELAREWGRHSSEYAQRIAVPQLREVAQLLSERIRGLK